MERKFYQYSTGASAIVVPTHEGMFSIKIWADDSLVCDAVTDRKNILCLLEDFLEIDDEILQYQRGEINLDIGGG